MRLAYLCIVFLCATATAQSIPEWQPKLGALIDKSEQAEEDFKKLWEECSAFYSVSPMDRKDKPLSKREKELVELCDFEIESYWAILGNGCSWYCCGGEDTISATSYLKSAKIDYSPRNIHDLDYESVWIEGKPGYGIGESITYHFPPQNPRITEIIVVNGYVKSEQLWRENSRVKKLKMYLNGKPLAYLHLDDSRHEQHFKVEPIGNSQREDWQALLKKPWWTMTFEIPEVYPGTKYDDTVITEIYFDGIDVH